MQTKTTAQTKKTTKQQASAPAAHHTYFVVSDVHGFYTIMMDALKAKGFDINNPHHHVVICGDAFDRGKEPHQMFNFMRHMAKQDRLIYIEGNHESLLFDCYTEMVNGWRVSSHHRHNKTVDTICMLSGVEEWELREHNNPTGCGTARYKLEVNMKPVLDFINEHCVPYAELTDVHGQHYIFTHGWIPAKPIYFTDICYSLDKYTYNPYWRDSDQETFRDFAWECGWQTWYGNRDEPGCRVPNAIVVCGHWHCNEPNHYLHEVGEGDEWTTTDYMGRELPLLKERLFGTFKETNDFKRATKNNEECAGRYEIDDPNNPSKGGIWCLDACTAHSEMVNVERIICEEK